MLSKKNKSPLSYQKPNIFCYSIARIASFFAAHVFFRRKFLRNEIKGVKGAYLVIGNHEASLDFVNLIGATWRRITFVISNSYYQSVPVHNVLKGMKVIPKQQFQTEPSDLKRMKAVVQSGHPLALYPAGMMSDNGLSTPIPEGTYAFLRWLGTDVYAARTVGSYFVMPKWSKGFRRGRTTMDIYKLFDKEELKTLSDAEIRHRVEDALLFDAYREQEKNPVPYRNGNNVAGLENVLYLCPECKKEFTIFSEQADTLTCKSCGYSEKSDAYGFFHLSRGTGKEIRYASDWSSLALSDLREKITSAFPMKIRVSVQTIDYKKHEFCDFGEGYVTLTEKELILKVLQEENPIELKLTPSSFPILPFSPGKYFELQYGKCVYRCLPEDSRIVIKFVNAVRILHERAEAKRNAPATL